MKYPIIPIARASAMWISGLIDVGILVVTENGIKCAENTRMMTRGSLNMNKKNKNK